MTQLSVVFVKTFREYFKNIDERERQHVIQELLLLMSSEYSDAGVAEAQASHRVCCAHSSSTDVGANDKDVQRYYCKTCSTYFREITGKVSFGLKKGQLLKTYLYHMLIHSQML